MKIPLKYIARNLVTRKLTTGITVAGVALVVFVFSAVLMLAHGVHQTLVATGGTDNVIITRKSSNGEISSIIDGDTQSIILTLPYIAKGANGQPIVSREPVVVINLNKIGDGVSNVTVRGVSEPAFALRPQVRLVEGRMFAFGSRELIVGQAIESRFAGAQIGDVVKFAGDQWKIVGKFEAGKSAFDSELWGDALQLLNAFNRGNSISSMTLKLERPEAFESFQRAFEAEQRLNQFEPKVERKYFEEQSEFLSLFISVLGIFVTVIFSAGATIGATITMYAAVANRTVEIGTLRALGFRRRSVLTAFLLESCLLALVGGTLGLVLSSLLQFFRVSTLNFQSFAELEFSFALSPQVILSSLLFALAMGIIGGFIPAVHAARLKIVNALRGA
ncbi:MAG TPA: ABC transporter permease [Bacteroidota bacterium]|nr:ABC transporter permease [Bacteroidota bacterium]